MQLKKKPGCPSCRSSRKTKSNGYCSLAKGGYVSVQYGFRLFREFMSRFRTTMSGWNRACQSREIAFAPMRTESKKSAGFIAGPLCGLVLIITGCAGEPATAIGNMNNTEDTGALAGVVWQLEDIDRGGIVDSSQVTMQLSGDGGINGFTGCNQYFGSVKIGASTFQVDGTGSTRRACVPAIMQQEHRFLRALQDVRRYVMDGEFLRLYDEAGGQRLRMIRSSEEPARALAPQPQDRVDPELQEPRSFDCPDGPAFTIRIVGPETLILSLAGKEHTLQRARAASGARYSNDEILFWNKGEEAVLEAGGTTYTCRMNT
ncbi:MAG: META domain-containing protein [Halioglobus sp.]|nr:META domain-containing protein [Halioglobus sp.]